MDRPDNTQPHFARHQAPPAFAMGMHDQISNTRAVFVEDNPKTPESEKNLLPKIPRKCCTLQEIKDRPEIILWYVANMISYLGFFMPFLNLVSSAHTRPSPVLDGFR